MPAASGSPQNRQSSTSNGPKCQDGAEPAGSGAEKQAAVGEVGMQGF